MQNAFQKLNPSDDRIDSFLPLRHVNSLSDPSEFASIMCPILYTQNTDLNNENLDNSSSTSSLSSLTSHSVLNA